MQEELQKCSESLLIERVKEFKTSTSTKLKHVQVYNGWHDKSK